MAFTAATPQATVQTALDKLRQATQLLELYIQVNNPGQLAAADAALTAASTAIAAVKA